MFKGSSLRLPNMCTPNPDLISCGLPSAQDLQKAHESGVKTIINLCPSRETPPDEARLVQELGMHYFNIPVAGPQDLTENKARELGEVVNNCDYHPVLIHCMSGNRVGAMLALKAYFVDAKSPKEALDAGREAGLRALDPEVWRILSTHAARES